MGVIDMVSKESEKLTEIFQIDDSAEDGAYCVEPTEEDLKAFAEHAKQRKNKKN